LRKKLKSKTVYFKQLNDIISLINKSRIIITTTTAITVTIIDY